MVGVLSQKLIREFPDVEADRAANRKNLLVIFGRERIAPVYSYLIILMFLLYIPFFFLGVKRISLLLLLLPMFFFAKNFVAMRRGDWKREEGLKFLNANGFLAMFMVPMSMIGVFLLGGF
jgi:4-hydroxybenzoate polyprenyltransferase